MSHVPKPFPRLCPQGRQTGTRHRTVPGTVDPTPAQSLCRQNLAKTAPDNYVSKKKRPSPYQKGKKSFSELQRVGTFERVNLLSLPLGQCNTSFQGKHRQTTQSVQKQVPCAYMLILADRRLPSTGMCLHPTWQAALGRGMGDAPNPFPEQRFPGAGLTLTTHLCKPGIDLLDTPRASWS